MCNALLYREDKTSLGVSCIDEATPWDDCPYPKVILSSVLMIIGFSLATFTQVLITCAPYGVAKSMRKACITQ